jgi:GNAT superfamily N-acetyltransferase
METILTQADGFTLQLTDTPGDDNRAFLHQQIRAYNNNVSPHHLAVRQPGARQSLAVFLRDETGQIIGGLAGDTYWNWLEIDDFWIAESWRGQGVGRKMLHAAEVEAMLRGCTHAVLKTFDFQAFGFYSKSGYRAVGQLDDYPPGHTFYWLRKEFGRAGRVTFRSVRSEADTLAYLVQINRNYPDRPALLRHIESHLAALPGESPPVVELCCGPGMLARHLVSRLPQIRYTGFDESAAFVDFASRQLRPFASRTKVIRADVNADDWPAKLPGPAEAIVSLQSLHDLGDESHVRRIYCRARELLAPGGLFLNADLVVPPAQPHPTATDPGRLSIHRHMALLRVCGLSARWKWPTLPA